MYSRAISQPYEAIGVIPPPPDVTPNFANPPSRVRTFIALNIMLISISTLFIGIRFYTARYILRLIRADDCKLSSYFYQQPQLIVVDMLLAAWVRLISIYIDNILLNL
jgi:hypothetical protein